MYKGYTRHCLKNSMALLYRQDYTIAHKETSSFYFLFHCDNFIRTRNKGRNYDRL